MLSRRRVFSVEPLWNGGRAWRPAESSVVLTSASMCPKLQEPLVPEPPLCLEQAGKVSGEMGDWDQAGSPTDQDFLQGSPHPLGFLPTSGRLLKSESEDSGVEMASSDHAPLTPVGSEKSFSLDGFQPSSEDCTAVPPGPRGTCAQGLDWQGPAPSADQAHHRHLSVSRKLAQVVQRSQKHRLPGRATRQLGRRPQSLEDVAGLQSPRVPVAVDGQVAGAAGARGGTPPGCSIPERWRAAEEAHVLGGLTMPGQGLRYLEHLCQMLEKIAQLQRANLRLRHQHQVLECRIWAQDSENEVPSEGGCGTTAVDSLPEDPAVPETEEEDPSSLGSWRTHLFRARSASETALRSPAGSLGTDPDRARTAGGPSASFPSLLDQLDGGCQTLPAGLMLKPEPSHWGRVKVLISRIARRPLRTAEPAQHGEPALGGGECRTDPVTDKPGPHPSRRFLPTLGAKKRRSKLLSRRGNSRTAWSDDGFSNLSQR